MTDPLSTQELRVSELTRSDTLCAYLNRSGLPVDKATATYTRYKPHTGAVIAMELMCDGVTHLAYLRHSVDPNRATQIVTKARTKRPHDTELGPSVRRLDDHNALFLFPTDAKLQRLRWVASADKIRHVVNTTFDDGPYCAEQSTITILRYKPERRLVGKAHLVPKRKGATRSFVYRLTVGPDAPKLMRINQAARNAGIETPRPITTLEDGRLHLEEALDATPLVDAIVNQHVPASAIAEILHQTKTINTDFLDITTPVDDLSSALDALHATETYQPTLASEIAALHRSLVAKCPDDCAPVTSHGDLHLHQFMVHENTTYLVDWERATQGHPARDAGRLLAHPHALSIRLPELPIALLTTLVSDAVDEYRQRQPIAEQDLGFYLAVAFIDQALLVSRHLEANNCRKANAMLSLAAKSLAHGTKALTIDTPTDWHQT